MGEDFSKAVQPGTFDFKVSGPIIKWNLNTVRIGVRVCTSTYSYQHFPSTRVIPTDSLTSYVLLQGKYKYNAWKKVATEENLSPADAQKKYVGLIEQHKKSYGYDANKAPE